MDARSFVINEEDSSSQLDESLEQHWTADVDKHWSV